MANHHLHLNSANPTNVNEEKILISKPLDKQRNKNILRLQGFFERIDFPSIVDDLEHK